MVTEWPDIPRPWHKNTTPLNDTEPEKEDEDREPDIRPRSS